MRKVLLTLAVLAVGAGVGAAGFIWSGWYDISATGLHTQTVHALLEKTMHQSVKRRAASIPVPPLDDARLATRGGHCYVAKCVQCHGGPAVAQDEIGRSMQPVPGPLVDAASRWKPAELFWITRNGIKMSGMPAWQFRLPDDDIWSLVAFMQRLPQLTAPQFARVVADARRNGCGPAAGSHAGVAAAVDPVRGRLALSQHACSACHHIPGVAGSDVHVGPPLDEFAGRQLIAGRLPNTPDNLVRWIRDPRSVDPLTTMPDMQVSERDARDIAAYLATLR